MAGQPSLSGQRDRIRAMPSKTPPLAIAHRGGTGLWPENTLEAFEHAIGLGADGLELDLHMTREGILVVHHDDRLKPEIARGPEGAWLQPPTPKLRELTWAELQQYDVGRLRPGSSYAAQHPEQQAIDGARIPSFESLLSLVKRKARQDFRLFVELKTDLLNPWSSDDIEDLSQRAAGEIRKAGLEQQSCFVSFDWRTLMAASKIAPEISSAFTTLPFSWVAPEGTPPQGSDINDRGSRLRQMNLEGALWYGGHDWRQHPPGSYGARLLSAISAAGGKEWFAYHRDVTAETAAFAETKGLSIAVWTVDDPSEMRRLANLDVSAILTDRPDRLLDTL